MLELFELIDGLKYLANNDLDPDELTDRTAGLFQPRKGSIMNRARNSTCQYPLLVSSNLSIDDYGQIRTIMEQLYTSNLRMTIQNAAQVINLKAGDNVSKVISAVHQNDYANYGFSGHQIAASVKDAIDSLSEANIFFGVNDKKEISNSNRKLLKPYLENFNYNNLNSNKIKNEATTTSSFISNPNGTASIIDYYEKEVIGYKSYLANGGVDPKEIERRQDAIHSYANMISRNATNKTFASIDTDRVRSINSAYMDTITGKAKIEELNGEKIMADINNKNLTNQKLMREIQMMDHQMVSVGRVNADMVIKKNNELEPSMFEMDFYYNNGTGNLTAARVVVGVKCVTHLIPYEELCKYIPETLVKKKAIFRAIQWTTGEIKLFRDLIFDFDNQKHMAVTKDSSVKWWRHLHSRSNASRIRNSVGNQKCPLIPNASIVMSSIDMEFIKLSRHIDLMGKDKYLMNKLMDYYFLLNFIVVDCADNVLYMWNDAYKDWDRYTFKQLDKETKDAMNRNNRITLR